MSEATLLLLHGYTGRGADFEPVLAELPPGTRALTPDLHGHDPASPARAAIPFEAEVERIAAIARPAAPVRLCGYSLGGRVALGLACTHPELVESLLLVGAHAGIDDPAERAARVAADEVWCAVLEREGIEAFVDRWEAQPIFATQSSLAPDVREAQRRRRLGHDAASLAHAMRTLGLGVMPSFWGALARLAMPVRLVVGEADTKFRGVAARMKEHLPHAELRVVPGGHNVLLEQPRELARALGW